MTKKEAKNLASKRCIARKKAKTLISEGKSIPQNILERLTLGLTKAKSDKYKKENPELFKGSKPTKASKPTKKETLLFGGFSLKNIKTFEGVEGYGFSASLYYNGKKVGLALDDAWGGGAMLRVHGNKEAQDAIDAYVKAQPKKVYDFGSFDYDEENFANDMVEHFELVQKAKRKRKTHTFAKIGDYVYSFNIPYSIKGCGLILKKHPKAEIIHVA
jgi:hypothetical protein